MLIPNIEKQVFLPHVIDNLEVMIWIKNKNGNLIYLNNSAKQNLFDGDIDSNECPLSCSMSDMVETTEDVIERFILHDEEKFLRCKKIPLDNEGMMVIAEDITNMVNVNEKAVKVLNDKIDQWKEKRERKSEISDVFIQNILNKIRDIKRDRNIKDE